VSLFAAMAWQLHAQQPSAPATVGDPLSLVHRFFPFHVGDRLTYRLTGEQEIGSREQAHTVPMSGDYTETVVAIRRIRRTVELVEIERKGKSGAYANCDSEDLNQPETRFWYVLSPRAVIVSCEHEEAMKLALELSESPSRGVKEYEDGYLLPFKVGMTWGTDPGEPKRADQMYRWVVMERTGITVSAGKFPNCYEMTYRTLPDDEEKWVCEGAGLAKDDYEHHGTTRKYRIEVVSAVAAPMSSASGLRQHMNR
jgi:hypothetical protein